MTGNIPLDSEKTEEWLLSALQRAETPLQSFIEALENIRGSGQREKADACAELLQESLVERNAGEDAIGIMAIQAGWHGGESAYAAACTRRLQELFRNMPAVLKRIPHAAFNTSLDTAESLRRLLILVKLRPGVLCRHKTWGFGIVRRLDEETSRATIDFKTRLQHEMSFAYSAETLELLGNGHVLAEQHRDPESFSKRLEEDPAGVVKHFIRDFGPMNVEALRELIVSNVDAVTEWKPFWESARKQLKRDPLIVIPTKRSDPIRALESSAALDEHWVGILRTERDPERILDLVEDWKNKRRDMNITAALGNAIEERLEFAARGAGATDDALAARALLLADELDFTNGFARKEALIDRLLDPEHLGSALQSLPARSVAPLISFLAVHRPAGFKAPLLQLVPGLRLQALSIVVDSLVDLGHETDVAGTLRNLVQASDIHVDVMSWLCCRTAFVFRNGVCAPDKFVFLALTALETARVAGKRVQATNRMRDCFRNDEWLKATVGPLDEMQRSDLVLRLRKSPAFRDSERNMIVARLAKLFPELQAGLRSGAPETSRRRVTSLRSYAGRQAQLRNLINIEIPKNIREIASARSHGDLSENYEYQAARETQRTLADRRRELEQSLSEVEATAFENASRDKAGIGTCVALRREDGETERYAILGEWDNDEKLGIISYASGLARILDGHSPGDRVVIPKENSEVSCVIEQVSGLPAEIREWIHAVPKK